MKRNILLALIFFSLLSASSFAEILYLKTGKMVKGEILSKTEEKIVIKTETGQMTYFKEEVAGIDESSKLVGLSDKDISEEEVRAVLKEIDVGFNLKNVDILKEIFWEDARFIMNDSGNKLDFPLAQYLEILNETFSQLNVQEYKYNLEKIKIDGNKAFCSGVVEETITAEDGTKIVTHSQSEDVFEKRDGKLKLFYSEAEIISVK